MIRMTFTLNDDSAEQLDKLRGKVPKSTYLNQLIHEDYERRSTTEKLKSILQMLMDRYPDTMAKLLDDGFKAAESIDPSILEEVK